ncbi:glycosyltransferase [Acinetobacter sp. ANC 4282]|uniref:glycosyltransferase n=1 Tax=Acinetobacter terrae TaxID=2731247 RepID=UPI00148FEEC2|nr:glycosyltransferase [Acinetobacter terrae]NNH15816.1 glycosyltransferase [Acinetobacter terrae]
MSNLFTTPLVTVVIPSYNHEHFIQDCINSIINQNYQNIELIIIDDGSTDQSVKKIEQLIEHCIHRFTRFEFRNRSNKGLCNTLNEALAWAKGDFFSVLASDDMIMPDKISIQVDYLTKNKKCVAVFGGMKFIDNEGEIIGQRVKKYKKFDFKDILIHRHRLPAPTQLIRKSVFDKTEGFNENLKIEDWDMWLKLSRFGTLDYLPQVFSLYRSHEDNTMKKFNLISQERMKIINLYQNSPYYAKAWKRIKMMDFSYYIDNNDLNNALSVYIEVLKRNPMLVLRFAYIKKLFLIYFKNVNKS